MNDFFYFLSLRVYGVFTRRSRAVAELISLSKQVSLSKQEKELDHTYNTLPPVQRISKSLFLMKAIENAMYRVFPDMKQMADRLQNEAPMSDPYPDPTLPDPSAEDRMNGLHISSEYLDRIADLVAQDFERPSREIVDAVLLAHAAQQWRLL